MQCKGNENMILYGVGAAVRRRLDIYLDVDDGRTRGIPRVRVNLCASRIGFATWQGKIAVPKATYSPRGKVSQVLHIHVNL